MTTKRTRSKAKPAKPEAEAVARDAAQAALEARHRGNMFLLMRRRAGSAGLKAPGWLPD